MQVRVVPGRSAVALVVAGVIDGPIRWPTLPAELRRATPVIDLDGVTEMTPAGVRAWRSSMEALTAPTRILVRIRPSILPFFNLTGGMLEGCAIANFYAPYMCASCREPFESLVDLRIDQQAIRALSPPFARCPTCGGAGAFDDEPSAYLSQVASAPSLSLPEGVYAFLQEPREVSRATSHFELDVRPDFFAVWVSGTLSSQLAVRRIARQIAGPTLVVAANVHATTAGGLDAMRDLLATLGPQVWVARASTALVQGLAATLNGWGQAQVVSVRLPFRCETCQESVLVDVDVEQRRTLASGGYLPCRTCHRPLHAAYSDREVMVLHTVPMTSVPPSLAGYLMAMERAPSEERQSSEWTKALEGPATDGIERNDDPVTLPPRVPRSRSDAGAAIDDPPSSTMVDKQRPLPRSERGNGATRYQIIRRLGVGGMAETLLGRQVGIGGFEKRVVIKHILPTLASNPAFVEMFLHEARVAARINHQNVVQIFDFGRSGDQYYIVMEYVRGSDLSTLLRWATRFERPVPIELACRMTADLCAGLSAAHAARDDHGSSDPIIHRDVSPHNVLVSIEGGIKLADFGIAKQLSGVQATRPGEIKGKVTYMAPETLRGEPANPKVDIYAAGLVLYTLLAGRNPYQRHNEVQSMYAVAHESPPPILTQRRDVPFQLAAILARAIHRDPGARFPAAQMLQLHLESFLGEYGKQATPMHVALWANEITNLARERDALVEEDSASNPSSPDYLDLGTLATPDALDEALDPSLDPSLVGARTIVTGELTDERDDKGDPRKVTEG